MSAVRLNGNQQLGRIHNVGLINSTLVKRGGPYILGHIVLRCVEKQVTISSYRL